MQVAGQPSPLVLAGGTVVDPGRGVHAKADVAIAGGAIVAVGTELPRPPGTQVVDVGGRFVTPGLIDIHTHLFHGVSDLGVEADANCLAAGVTTAIDAGTAGAATWPAFRDGWIRPATTRILAFVNLSAIGLIVDDGWEYGETELRYVDVGRLVDLVRSNPDVIVGIKVRIATNQTLHHGDAPLRLALEAAERAECRLMVHITDPGIPLDGVFDRLRSGDIVTHLYHGRGETIVRDGRVLLSARRARERGVLMDVGHGAGSFAFPTAVAALADGFPPDTISTDLHTGSLVGACRDLPTTMAKFMALGLSLDEVVAAVTIAPARLLGRPEVPGTLRPGAVADVAVLEEVRGPTVFEDVHGATLAAGRSLRAAMTIRAGRIVLDSMTENGQSLDNGDAGHRATALTSKPADGIGRKRC